MLPRSHPEVMEGGRWSKVMEGGKWSEVMEGGRWSGRKVLQLIGIMELLRMVYMTTGLDHTTGGKWNVQCYHGDLLPW